MVIFSQLIGGTELQRLTQMRRRHRVCVNESRKLKTTKRAESHEERTQMLNWTITFLIVALIAGLLGFVGIAGMAALVAKVCFVIFLVLFLASLIQSLVHR